MFAGVTRVPLPPHPGDRINRSMLSCRDMAPWLSIHSPTTKWGEGGGASHQRGDLPRPSGQLYGFSRQRRYKKWRQRRRTFPAGTVSQPIGKPFNGQAKGLLWLTWRSYAGPPQYFIPSEGGSPEPVREASAGPGQNPWRPGPKARRRHQPSPAKAGVNLREYWKAPPRSRFPIPYT